MCAKSKACVQHTSSTLPKGFLALPGTQGSAVGLNESCRIQFAVNE